jgi:ribosome biogenesis GTPase A
MAIQWFPGHMTTARDKAAETMERTDVVIEVVDARLPEASTNPMIRALREHRQRPCLEVLNKSDLADPVATRSWLNHYNAQKGVTAVAISCKNPSDVAKVLPLCRKIAPHRDSAAKPLRLMIMGIPNVGKSTLMNALLKRRVAKVGDEPAVTKSQQSLELDVRTLLTDTPGLMWPKIRYDSDGFMLAASHAVGTNAVIEEEVATFLAANLLERYPALLTARYWRAQAATRNPKRKTSNATPARLASADWVLFDYDVLDALLGMAGRSLLAELRARLAELGFDTRRIQPIEADGQHRLLVHCAPRSVDAARAA